MLKRVIISHLENCSLGLPLSLHSSLVTFSAGDFFEEHFTWIKPPKEESLAGFGSCTEHIGK